MPSSSSAHVRESRTVLDSGSHAVDSEFQLLDSSRCQWNLDSGFQSLVGFQIPWTVFRIPKARILDSTSKNFPHSGIGIPLHGAIVTSVKLDETSGIVLANICKVYATTILAVLWRNISTPRDTVSLIPRCVVWLFAVEPISNGSSVKWGWFSS